MKRQPCTQALYLKRKSRDGSNPRTIECLYLNARSLNNKTNELQTLVTDVDLVAITETWLKPEIGNCEVLPGNDFTIHRKDRVDRIGGGTLLARCGTVYFVLEKTLKLMRKC